jgi:poly-gamma-glutamate biosynthesis protein PgsC/CapC
MAGTSIVVSIVLGFLFGELTGWLTGGLVVPGYLALYVDQPLRVVMTYAAAALAFLAVKLLARVTILFGRRRFMAFILAGICMGALLDALVSWWPPTGSDLRAIGYVVPGLIANDTWKQGPWKTLLASLAITLATRAVLLLVIH